MSLWAIILVTHPFFSAYCQNYDFRFENITSSQSLADRVVNAIIQDSRGFIWIGSGEGLTRYDGYSCISYRHEPDNPHSLSDNEIYTLCSDNEGVLWIGTSNGLNKYDARNDRFERFFHDSTNNNSLSDNEILTLTKDAAGNLWIGTYGSGLDLMKKMKNNSGKKNEAYQFIHHRYNKNDSGSISSNEILSHCFDKAGNSWIGTSNGLNLLAAGKKKFTRFFHNPERTNSISNSTVNRIFPGNDGGIWICGRGMLDKIVWYGNTLWDSISVQHFLPAVIANKKLSDWVINDFITDRNGNGLMATNDQGLVKFNLTRHPGNILYEQFVSNPQIPYTVASSNVYCFFEDNSGVIWIGTSKGVSKYVPSKARFNELNHLGKSFQANKGFVMAVLSDKQNRLWLADDSDTLYIIRKNRNHSSSIHTITLGEPGKGIGQVNMLYESKAGDIYVGTLLKGLFIIAKSLNNISDRKRWIHITVDQYPALLSNNIYSISEDAAGLIYIGTYKGLCTYNPFNRQIQSVYASPYGTIVSDYIIRTVCIDTEGTVWCGTDNGVLLIKNGAVIKSFKKIEKDTTSLSHNKVTACYVDHNKNIWIGTKNGLNRYDPKHKNFDRFSAQNGLSDVGIRSLREDAKGNLWIATDHGLVAHNLHEKKFYSYGIEDGLVSDQFITNAVSSDDTGIFYFGTNNGLVSFKPENIKPNDYVPPVAITNIRILNTPLLSVGDTNLINTYRRENRLVLNYNQNFFSFEFAALNYINSVANQYAYKLEGVDKQWNYSGTQRFAGYTDIAPGHYVFKVKASNNDNVWNNVPSTVAVIIIPPWWQTWWFYLLCLIALCIIIYLIYRVRLQQVLKVYKVRSSIAKDLHDDVGSALSSIALLSNIARDGKTNSRLKPEEIFSRIGDTSKHMIDLMDDIVWSVNPANDRFSNMLIRMREYAVEMLEAKNISFTFKVSEDLGDLKIPMGMRKDYFLIFKEAVNNLAKYSGCSNATILIERSNRSIITTISDDGKGFDPEAIHSGHGLKNMQERAKTLKGKFQIETEPEKGTRITFVTSVT